MVLQNGRSSLELVAAAQRIRIVLDRASVIDPETLIPVRAAEAA